MAIDDQPTPNELRVLELEKEVKRLASRCQFYEDDAAAAWDKCEERRKNFAKYGQHLGNCAGPGHCDCGFTLITAAEQAAAGKQGEG